MLIWSLPALLAGVLRAYAFDINRKYKIDGRIINFWRLAAIVPILFIASLFFSFPQDAKFYLVSMLSGLTIGIGDAYLWKMAAQNNSRISVMLDPVNAFFLFILWLFLNATALNDLISKPLVFLGVCLSYFCLLCGVFLLRKCKLSWPALKILFIICFFNAINVLLIRFAIRDLDSYLVSTLIMVLCSYSVAMLVSGIFYFFQEGVWPEFKINFIKPAVLMGLLIGLSTLCSVFSYLHAPNPGYAVALVALAPMWLFFFHKIIGVKNEGSYGPIFLIFLSGVILIILVR